MGPIGNPPGAPLVGARVVGAAVVVVAVLVVEARVVVVVEVVGAAVVGAGVGGGGVVGVKNSCDALMALRSIFCMENVAAPYWQNAMVPGIGTPLLVQLNDRERPWVCDVMMYCVSSLPQIHCCASDPAE